MTTADHELDEARGPSFLARAALALAMVWSFRLIIVALAVGWATLPTWLPDAVPPFWRACAWVITVPVGLLFVRSYLFIADTWRPPTPALAEADHPELFQLIHDVAAALDTRAPHVVYLVPDANAWVREARRFFGLRVERTLVLGTALLCTSTVSELRATIAHELAHFVGGDTRLSLSVARTRQGMLQLLQELHGGFFFRPVVAYAAFFLTLTQNMSRAQELWADRSSVRIAGRAPHQASLRAAVVADVLMSRMLERGVPFLLACGFLPANVYSTLRAAAKAPSQEAQEAIEEELREKPGEVFDSHPPTEERIRAAAEVPEPEGIVVDDRPALTLFGDDAVAVERDQTAALLRSLRAPELPLLPEDEDPVEHAIRPQIERTAREARERAAQMFGEDNATDDERALRAYLEMAARSEEDTDPDPQRRAMGEAVREMVAPGIGALIALVELARGGELVSDGVERPSIRRGAEHLWPFEDAARAAYEPTFAAELLARLDT